MLDRVLGNLCKKMAEAALQEADLRYDSSRTLNTPPRMPFLPQHIRWARDFVFRPLKDEAVAEPIPRPITAYKDSTRALRCVCCSTSRS